MARQGAASQCCAQPESALSLQNQVFSELDVGERKRRWDLLQRGCLPSNPTTLLHVLSPLVSFSLGLGACLQPESLFFLCEKQSLPINAQFFDAVLMHCYVNSLFLGYCPVPAYLWTSGSSTFPSPPSFSHYFLPWIQLFLAPLWYTWGKRYTCMLLLLWFVKVDLMFLHFKCCTFLLSLFGRCGLSYSLLLGFLNG